MRARETMVMANPLVPFLLWHGLAGMLAGWLTAGLVLAVDLGQLRQLIFGGELWLVPLVMLFGGFALTFASLAMGAGIMGLGRSAEAD